jgi:hydroxymethylpyrimidine pyrophosphatase-like HAD family hydrolase
MRSAMRGRLDVVRTGPQVLELMAPRVTKGAALARLMAEAVVWRGEVLAIGDNFNDRSMFEMAALSVAMANAPRVVRESAGAVTADCADDGVAAALRRYVLNGASTPARGME